VVRGFCESLISVLETGSAMSGQITRRLAPEQEESSKPRGSGRHHATYPASRPSFTGR